MTGPRSPSFNEADGLRQAAGASRAVAERRGTPQSCDGLIAVGGESLLAVDEAVARIVHTLRADRLVDTVIVFTTDNGYLWGSTARLRQVAALSRDRRRAADRPRAGFRPPAGTHSSDERRRRRDGRRPGRPDPDRELDGTSLLDLPKAMDDRVVLLESAQRTRESGPAAFSTSSTPEARSSSTT